MLKQRNIEYKSSWHNDSLKWVCDFVNKFYFIKIIDLEIVFLPE